MNPKNVCIGKTLDEVQDLLERGGDDDRIDAMMELFERAHLEGIVLGDELAAEPAIGVARRAWYALCRLRGTSPLLALMMACNAPPCVQDDTTFWRGRWNQFADDPRAGDYYRSVAEAHGANVTGAVYMPTLAAFPGDPQAWVRGKGDIKRLVEDRGWGCQGEVNVKARNDVEPAADIDVADDIVETRLADMMEANPDLAHRKREDVFQEAKQSLLPAA